MHRVRLKGQKGAERIKGLPLIIRPEVLPQGWRFLRPGEMVKETDYFWSHCNKCYLPATRKPGWRSIAGVIIPFIRKI